MEEKAVGEQETEEIATKDIKAEETKTSEASGNNLIQGESYPVPCIFPLPDEMKALMTGKTAKPLFVEVPGSKSITNRALLLATLAKGRSVLRGVLFSDDSRHFLSCIQKLGFETEVEEAQQAVTVTGLGGAVPMKEASIYVGSAGTAARFLTAYLGVSHGSFRLDASPQMRRRPMKPLLAALKELGCEITCEEADGCFPFLLNGHGFGKQSMCVDIGRSSQFLSALLISACLSPESVEIRVNGTHGMAYIHMTRRMMEQFGVNVAQKGGTFLIEGGQRYRPLEYQIEPDVSAACYFYAMAPLLGIKIMVKSVYFESLQGDVEFLRILERMGCVVEELQEGICVTGNPMGQYEGIEADMSACSDQAITLAAVAPFAQGPTRIKGIGHIRFQESDRIDAISQALGAMGIRCEAEQDAVTIYPGMPKACRVKTFDDHRLAMGFALTGLRAPGIVIDDPLCCRKTFEHYFQVLEQVAGVLQ